jgi:DNA-binding response OmpR family regulator
MSYHIHCCDDEPHIVLAVSLKFSKAGFRVTSDGDGQAAWESIQRERPQLLITDLQMPGMDGLELIRRIRANPELHDLPVILLTAKGLEFDNDELRERFGVSEIVCKPFSPRELVERVRTLLNESVTTAN